MDQDPTCLSLCLQSQAHQVSERMNEWAQALAQGLRGALPSLPAKAHLQNPGEMGAQTGRGVK